MIYWRAVVHRKMQARFGGGTTEKGLLDTSLAAYVRRVTARKIVPAGNCEKVSS